MLLGQLSVFLTFCLSGWLHTKAIGSFAVLNGPCPTTNPLYCSNGEILMHRSFPVTLTSDIRGYPNKLLALSPGEGCWVGRRLLHYLVSEACLSIWTSRPSVVIFGRNIHKVTSCSLTTTTSPLKGCLYALTRTERRSKEEWSAPPSHHLGQKDSFCHRCIDFKELHHMNVMKCYLLPADFHRLWCGARAQRHTKAYHRISVHGEWKKAFNIPRGYNEYLIMLLRINNAPTLPN